MATKRHRLKNKKRINKKTRKNKRTVRGGTKLIDRASEWLIPTGENKQAAAASAALPADQAALAAAGDFSDDDGEGGEENDNDDDIDPEQDPDSKSESGDEDKKDDADTAQPSSDPIQAPSDLIQGLNDTNAGLDKTETNGPVKRLVGYTKRFTDLTKSTNDAKNVQDIVSEKDVKELYDSNLKDRKNVGQLLNKRDFIKQHPAIRTILTNNKAASNTFYKAIEDKRAELSVPTATSEPDSNPNAPISSILTTTATPTSTPTSTSTSTPTSTAIETKAAVTNVLAIKVKDKDLKNMLEKYGKYMNTTGVRGGAPSKAEIKDLIDASVRDNGFILGIPKDNTAGYEQFEYATYKDFESKLDEFTKTYPDSAEDIKTIKTRFKADELKYRNKIKEKFDDLENNPNALILDDKVKILMSGLGASKKLEKDIVKLFNRTKVVDRLGIVTYPFEHADNKPFNKPEYITHCKFIVLFAKIKNKYIFPTLINEPQEPTFKDLISIESGYLQTKADEWEKNNSSSPVISAIDLIIAPLDVANHLKTQLADYKKVVWAEAAFTSTEFDNLAMYSLVDDRLLYTVSHFDAIEPRLKGIQSGDDTDNPNKSPDVKAAATIVLKDLSKRVSNSPNKGSILSSIKNFTKKNRSDVDEGIYKKLENVTNQNTEIQLAKTNLITVVKNGDTPQIEIDTKKLLEALNSRKDAITLVIKTNENKLKGNIAETEKLGIKDENRKLEKEVQELNVNITEVTSILSDKDKNKRSTFRNILGLDKLTLPKPKTTVPELSPDTTPRPDFVDSDPWVLVDPYERKDDREKKYVRIEIEGEKVTINGELITTTGEWNDVRRSLLGLKPQEAVKLQSFNGKIVFDVYTNGKMTIRMNNGATKTINNQVELDAFKEKDMKAKPMAVVSKKRFYE